MISHNLFHFQSFLFFLGSSESFYQIIAFQKLLKENFIPFLALTRLWVYLRKIYILKETNTFIESTLLNKTKYYIVAEFPEIYAHNKKAEERMVAVLMNH